jgi:hypothetical protein
MERLAVDRDVAVDRGDNDVAMKGDAPYRFRQVQRMGEQSAVGQPPHPYRVIAAAGDHWVPSRSTPTAIALAEQAGVFQRKRRGRWRWA